MQRIILLEVRAKKFPMLPAVGVDRRLRQVCGFFGREVIEVVCADRLDNRARRIDTEHAQLVVPGEMENIAVVLPAVSPALVPARFLEEFRIRQLASHPAVELRLVGIRKHFQPYEDFTPRFVKRPDQPGLYAVEVHVRVVFPDEQHTYGLQSHSERAGVYLVAFTGVDDAVENDLRLAVPPVGVTDREIENSRMGAHAVRRQPSKQQYANTG